MFCLSTPFSGKDRESCATYEDPEFGLVSLVFIINESREVAMKLLEHYREMEGFDYKLVDVPDEYLEELKKGK